MDSPIKDLPLTAGIESDGLRIMYYNLATSYECTYHSYEATRICAILSGDKKVKINNTDFFIADASELIVLPPFSQVNLEVNKPTTALVVEISDHLVKNIISQVNLIDSKTPVNSNESNLLHPKKTPDLEMLLSKIERATVGIDKNKDFLINLYTQELTYHLLKKQYLQEGQKGREEFIWLALQMMNEQLLDTATITDIAAALNMSLSNFSSRFKQSMGVSPNKYLTNLKLSYAKKQLQQSNKNVTEIAYDLGYENISYFIGLFKDKYGMTPKQFTKRSKM